MQFEITDGAAIIFAEEFYAATADGYPVDAALVEARKAIFAAGNDIEWGRRLAWRRVGRDAGSDAAKPRGPGWSNEGGGRGDLTIGQSGRANTPLRRHHLPPAYFPPSITSSVLVK
jgi:hypothetical protein